MFLCSERKIYVYKVSTDVFIAWLSLIEFAVERQEHVEVCRMAMRDGFSSIAWNSWGLSERARQNLEDLSLTHLSV